MATIGEKRAPTGTPFVKGDPRAGRRRGSLNKSTRELKKFLAFMLDAEWFASAKRRVLAGEAPHIEKFALEHLYGKPKEHIEVTTVDPTVLELIVVEARNGHALSYGNGSNGHNGDAQPATIDITPTKDSESDEGEGN